MNVNIGVELFLWSCGVLVLIITIMACHEIESREERK